MKDVTILIPAYNEEKHIEQAILSAVNQRSGNRTGGRVV